MSEQLDLNNQLIKISLTEEIMKKLFIFITILIFLTSCGGGGYGSSGSGTSGTNSYGSGSAPTGSFSGQVDPVQTTNN